MGGEMGQARTAWELGVARWLETFPDYAGDILRVIASAHRAPSLSGVHHWSTRSGKTPLVRVVGAFRA